MQAAIVCYLRDSVLQLLLKYPRGRLQHDDIWKVASEELLWIASLEDSVMRSLADVERARGEIEENMIIDLGNSNRPSEPMASQCWLLMQVGINLRQSVETVKLLHDCSRTSTQTAVAEADGR